MFSKTVSLQDGQMDNGQPIGIRIPTVKVIANDFE